MPTSSARFSIPTADLRWVEKGELQVLTVPDWLDRVRKRPSAKAEGKPREDFIVTIDRSDDQTAFVKVRCQLPPRYFTDYLVAMKLARRLEDRLEILSLRSARLIPLGGNTRSQTWNPFSRPLGGIDLAGVSLRIGDHHGSQVSDLS